MIESFQPEVSQPSPEGEGNWGLTTDPNQFNPNNFRYLVYAFLDPNHPTGGVNKWGTPQPAINLAVEPERLSEREALSTSLIDQDHPFTWAAGGMIIGAPRENVTMAGNTDLGKLVMKVVRWWVGRPSRCHYPKMAMNL